MGRRHSIAHKKAAGDAAKGKIYAKVGKIITIAAKKGADPDLNPSLALALQKARQHNLPRDVIDRAIKKGSGTAEGEDYQEIFYEAYGPGGVALYIKAITSNTNRSITNVKTAVQKHGGSMGAPGSVGRQFHHRGVIIIDGLARIESEKGKDVLYVDPYNKDDLEMVAMEMDVEDVVFEDELCIVTTTMNNYLTIDGLLREAGYHVTSSDLLYIPENTVAISDLDRASLEKIEASLDDDDDVDSVYTNVA